MGRSSEVFSMFLHFEEGGRVSICISHAWVGCDFLFFKGAMRVFVMGMTSGLD